MKNISLLIAVAAMSTFALVACTVTPSTPASSSSTTSSGDADIPDTQWDTVMAEITADGSMPLPGSLQAFSIAFGVLPGVTLPEGEPGGSMSGTLALRWIVSDWTKLTEDQRRAALAKVPELADTVPAPAAQRSVWHGSESLRPDRLEASVNLLFEFFLQKTGLADPGWRPTVRQSSTGLGSTWAYALPETNRCRIIAGPRLRNSVDADAHFVIAHEVFHCIQGIATTGAVPWAPWITEGFATWAASEAPDEGTGSPTPEFTARLWNLYLSSPERSMFSRAYDAWGFFSFLSDRGVDLWSRVADLPTVNADAFTSLVGRDEVLVDWASSWFRDSTLGSAWNLNTRGIPSTRAASLAKARLLMNGDSVQVSAQAAGAAVAMIEPHADLITIRGTARGHLRVGDDAELPVSGVDTLYCGRLGGCECPQGSPGSTLHTTPLPDGPIRVALSAGVSKAGATISGRALDCDAVDASPTGTWHLESVDSDSSGATSRTVVASGSVRLIVSAEGNVQIDYLAAALRMEELPSETGPPLSGHIDATMHFDPASGQISVSAWSGEIGFSSEGQTMPFAGNGLIQQARDNSYSVDSSQMTWTARTDGSVMVVTWARDPS